MLGSSNWVSIHCLCTHRPSFGWIVKYSHLILSLSATNIRNCISVCSIVRIVGIRIFQLRILHSILFMIIAILNHWYCIHPPWNETHVKLRVWFEPSSNCWVKRSMREWIRRSKDFLHTLFLCLMIIVLSINRCLPDKIYLHGCLCFFLLLVTLLACVLDGLSWSR